MLYAYYIALFLQWTEAVVSRCSLEVCWALLNVLIAVRIVESIVLSGIIVVRIVCGIIVVRIVEVIN